MLFQKYACPIEFMKLYIEQGRFGEWVSEIISIDTKNKREKAEKEEEQKLWELYLHSFPDKSFNEWKDEALKTRKPVSLSMNDDQVSDQIAKSRSILKGFSPS